MLDFLIEFRFDIYVVLAAIALCIFLPIYAGNLACASYIKAMIDRFVDVQDAEAHRSGNEILGERKTRAKTMTKQIRKQAKASRKANRGK